MNRDFELRSAPVPKCKGPVAPSAGFDIVIETGATCHGLRAADVYGDTHTPSVELIT
jgi:hypothetical protein